MHANQLVHLASLLSHHREALIHEADPVVPPALMDYWAAAKARHCRWADFLNAWQAEHASMKKTDAGQRERHWNRTRACLEEILLSDLTTRVFAAAAQAIDDRLGIREWSPVTGSIHQRQHEFRGRAMQLLLVDPDVPFKNRLALDQLRRRVERWTDFLLAPWSRQADVSSFAFDVDRVADHAETLANGHRIGNETYWTLAQASLEGAFRRPMFTLPFSARLNRQIAVSILGCFPQSLFSLDGEDAPAWVPRLLRTARQTEQLLDAALRPSYRS